MVFLTGVPQGDKLRKSLVFTGRFPSDVSSLHREGVAQERGPQKGTLKRWDMPEREANVPLWGPSIL